MRRKKISEKFSEIDHGRNFSSTSVRLSPGFQMWIFFLQSPVARTPVVVGLQSSANPSAWKQGSGVIKDVFTQTTKLLSRDVAGHGATMTEIFLIMPHDIARQEAPKISLFV
jgi:hypothetical protein